MQIEGYRKWPCLTSQYFGSTESVLRAIPDCSWPSQVRGGESWAAVLVIKRVSWSLVNPCPWLQLQLLCGVLELTNVCWERHPKPRGGLRVLKGGLQAPSVLRRSKNCSSPQPAGCPGTPPPPTEAENPHTLHPGAPPLPHLSDKETGWLCLINREPWEGPSCPQQNTGPLCRTESHTWDFEHNLNLSNLFVVLRHTSN